MTNTRSTPIKRRCPGAALRTALPLLLLPLLACESDVDDDEGVVALAEIPLARQGQVPLRKGYVGGKPAEFYDLGTFVPADASWFPSFDEFPGMPVNALYVFAKGDAPSVDQEQLAIIDHLPKQAGYSDFLEVVAVTPPAGYGANEIKSRGTLLRRGLELTRTGKIVNCPVVGPDAELGKTSGSASGRYPRLEVWYRKRRTHCILLDGGEALIGAEGAPTPRVFRQPVGDRVELRVAATELFAPITAAFLGADRVTGVPVPDNHIVRHAPDAAEYSPLMKVFEVTVPSDYRVGGLKSYADLYPVPDFTDPRIEARDPEAFCNCPVVWVEGSSK